MLDDLDALLEARDGHFVLESGLHGTLWLDLDAAFSRPDRLGPLARLLTPHRPTVVCGPLIGGALLAQMVAATAGVRLTYAERTAWTPGTLWSARYELPECFRALVRGRRVVVIDDVVNAGSALRSTVTAVQNAGGDVVASATRGLGSSATGSCGKQAPRCQVDL